MEEEGIIVKILKPGLAQVKLIRSTLCSNCEAKNMCHPTGGHATEMVVEVDDPLGVSVGQRVRINLPSSTVLKASFAVYILPLGALVAAGLAAQQIFQGLLSPMRVQFISAISGLLGMVVTYVALRYYLKGKSSGKYRPVVSAVIPEY
jgi:sigma-E factor negative regulatory protein RseC